VGHGRNLGHRPLNPFSRVIRFSGHGAKPPSRQDLATGILLWVIRAPAEWIVSGIEPQKNLLARSWRLGGLATGSENGIPGASGS
jgi:hypothetical protein